MTYRYKIYVQEELWPKFTQLQLFKIPSNGDITITIRTKHNKKTGFNVIALFCGERITLKEAREFERNSEGRVIIEENIVESIEEGLKGWEKW